MTRSNGAPSPLAPSALPGEGAHRDGAGAGAGAGAGTGAGAGAGPPRSRRRGGRFGGRLPKLRELALVLLCGVVVAGLAALLSGGSGGSGSASAVLVVPPGGVASIGANPSTAAQLTATYASLIPRDAALIDHVAASVGASPAAVRRALRVRQLGTGSVLSIDYRAASARASMAGARAALGFVLRPPATSASAIDASALRLVSRPTDTTPPGAARAAPATGADGTAAAGTPPAATPGADGTAGANGAAGTAAAGTPAPPPARPNTLGARSSAVVAVAATGASGGGDAQAANRLAANYAGLIPVDERILAVGASALGVPRDDVAEQLGVANDINTSLLRLTLNASSYAEARRGMLALVGALTGSQPVSRTIAPGSLQVGRLPARAAPAPGSAKVPLAVGAVLGLVLGGLLVGLRRRRDPAIADVDAGRELGVLVAQAPSSPEGLRALARGWGALEHDGPPVRLVPASAAAQPLARRLTRQLGQLGAASRPGRFAAVAPDTLALLMEEDGVDVLVVPERESFRAVSALVAEMRVAGARVDWLLLASADTADPPRGE